MKRSPLLPAFLGTGECGLLKHKNKNPSSAKTNYAPEIKKALQNTNFSPVQSGSLIPTVNIMRNNRLAIIG